MSEVEFEVESDHSDDSGTAVSKFLRTGIRTGLILSLAAVLVTVIAVQPFSDAEKSDFNAIAVLENDAELTAQDIVANAFAVTADTEWIEEGTEVASLEADPTPPPPVIRRTNTTSASRSTPARTVVNNPAPPSVAGNSVLEEAALHVGTPYVHGGRSPGGFDCSGFVHYVYKQLGINLPTSSGAYRNIGTVVSAADALPGDIIYTPGHVGIYAGDGLQIDAPRPGKTIQFRSIWQSNPTYIRVT